MTEVSPITPPMEPLLNPRELPRRKMGLFDQEHFLRSLAERCRMHGPAMRGIMAKEAILTLDRDDMAALLCIADTLNLFSAHGAKAYVINQMARAADRKAAKR